MLHRCQHQLVQELPELDDRHIGRFIDILISHRNRQRLFFQSHAAARRTRGNPHEGFILRLGCLGIRLAVSAGHVLNQSFKGNIVYAFSTLALVVHLDLLSIRSINQDVMDLLRVLLKRGIQVKLVFPAQCL